MRYIDPDILMERIDEAIEFRRTNQNDPYNLDRAVVVALLDLKDAILDSIKEPPNET